MLSVTTQLPCCILAHQFTCAPNFAPPLPSQVPADAAQLAAMQRRLAARYPAAVFAAARRRLDPKNVLGSPAIDALLPRGDS